MDKSLARRIHELLRETLELDPADRRQTIEIACADDPRLAMRKEQLLAAINDSQDFRFLDQPVLGNSRDSSFRKRTLPERIGNYRIVAAIGAGGMATVYEAIQDQPSRRVAIKVPHPDRRGGSHPELKLEWDALARLRHPAIAQIHEAGVHEMPDGTGLPWFAMEFVPDAKKLTHFAQDRKLSIDEKLQLFSAVCSAVHHGHRNGVVHRDLKPANILVDGEGNPKIIDFGVARAADPGDLAFSAAESDGRVFGTLNYISPELCTPGAAWDVRSDIYSLGVVLFELICGALPHSLADLPLPEALRRLRNDTPASPRTLNPAVDADLEAIILKAIERDPDRRYSSADALGSDLQRYRSHLPVEARPLTIGYQIRKFARRNRALTASLVAGFLLLVAGILVASRLAWQATVSQREAERRGEELEAVVQFQESLLRDLDIAEMGDRLVLSLSEAVAKAFPDDQDGAREKLGKLTGDINFSALAVRFLKENILQRYSDSIGREFDGRPLLQARMLQRLAGTFRALGLYADAEPALREALALRKEHLGDQHEDTLQTMHALGSILSTMGKLDEARDLLEGAYRGRAELLGAEHVETLRTGTSLGGLYRRAGKLEDAEYVWRRTLASQRKTLGDDDPETLRTLNNMGVVCAYQGKMDEAEKYWRELVERRLRVLGADDPDYRGSLGNLGALLLDQGKIAEARPLVEQALAADRRQFGDLHANTLVTMTQLAEVLHKSGELDKAERIIRECVEGRRTTFGPDDARTLHAEAALSMILLDRGKADAAESLLREVLERQRRILGDRNPETILSITFLSLLKQKSGAIREAVAFSGEAVQLARETELTSDLPLGEVLSRHGELLIELMIADDAHSAEDNSANDRNLQEQAVSLLQEGYDQLCQLLSDKHPKTKQAALRMARYHDYAHTVNPDAGHASLAADWRNKGGAK